MDIGSNTKSIVKDKGSRRSPLSYMKNNRTYLCRWKKNLPMRGLSEVTGMIEDTVLRNIVRERRMVTPKTEKNN